MCLTEPGRANETTACAIPSTENFQAETIASQLFPSTLVKKKTTWQKRRKKHKVKVTGREWKNQASSDVWNVLLLIFHVGNT